VKHTPPTRAELKKFKSAMKTISKDLEFDSKSELAEFIDVPASTVRAWSHVDPSRETIDRVHETLRLKRNWYDHASAVIETVLAS
jgi:hypothetical protein